MLLLRDARSCHIGRPTSITFPATQRLAERGTDPLPFRRRTLSRDDSPGQSVNRPAMRAQTRSGGRKAAGRGSDISGAEAHGPAASFDHLVGAGEYGGRNVKAQRPRAAILKVGTFSTFTGCLRLL